MLMIAPNFSFIKRMALMLDGVDNFFEYKNDRFEDPVQVNGVRDTRY